MDFLCDFNKLVLFFPVFSRKGLKFGVGYFFLPSKSVPCVSVL